MSFPWVCCGVGDFLPGMKRNHGGDSVLCVDDGRVGLRVFMTGMRVRVWNAVGWNDLSWNGDWECGRHALCGPVWVDIRECKLLECTVLHLCCSVGGCDMMAWCVPPGSVSA